MIEHIHWHRRNHGYFAVIVLEDEHHVEILQVKLDTLEVDEFDIFERYDE